MFEIHPASYPGRQTLQKTRLNAHKLAENRQKVAVFSKVCLPGKRAPLMFCNMIASTQVKRYGPYTDRIIGRSITDRNIIKIGPYTAVFSQYTDPRILCSKPSVVYGP